MIANRYTRQINTSRDISYTSNTDYGELTSRYAVLRKIQNFKENVAYLETQNDRYPEETPNDFYHIVKPQEVNRLDIISKSYYGSANLYWAIALANNIRDPFNIPLGMSLRIPAFQTLIQPGNKILML